MTAAPALQFDPVEHIYSLNGVAVPSVTQILSDVGIVDYSQIPDGIRVMALERGRQVHLITQFFDENDLGRFDPKLAGYLDAWKRFREETGFVPELIEHQVYNEVWDFAGTLDRTGVMAGARCLADIKTGIVPYWAAFQTAAYASCFDKPATFRRMAVGLLPDGSYRIHEFRCADFSAHLRVFLSALTIYQTKRGQSK
jgi:hypothetical protein